MTKIVVYNGGTEPYYGCSNPSVLMAGKRYEVVSENVRDGNTDYTLKGIEGKFNSLWFHEIKKKVKFAKALLNRDIYEYLGKKMIIYQLNCDETWEWFVTLQVESIENVYDSVYKIETQNTVYITEVVC